MMYNIVTDKAKMKNICPNNKYLENLINSSKYVKMQFLIRSHMGKNQNNNESKPWVGQIKTGIFGLERMYKDRLIIMPTKTCNAYCAHCIRKGYLDDKKIEMSNNDIKKAVKYIRSDPFIREVLITGGDPLTNIEKLQYVLDRVSKIDNVNRIRIGTRFLTVAPQKITHNLVKILKQYNNIDNKNIEISTQFNHPDELTQETDTAINRLIDSKIRVYNQSVLLKGINDNEKTLEELCIKLRDRNVDIYNLYHCAPAGGIEYLRTSIQKGMELKKHLRSVLSGRANPHYVILTPIGKAEIGTDSEIIKRDNDNHVWIKTPYTLKTFKEIDKTFKLNKNICYEDKTDGSLIVKYLDGTDWKCNKKSK